MSHFSLYSRTIRDNLKKMKKLYAIDKFYLLTAIFIFTIVLALIFNSLPESESIAQTMKGRILGISDQKIPLSVAIIIKDSEKEWRGKSDKTEISEIIKELEVPLYAEDLVSAFPDPKLGIGSSITIKRAPIIYLQDGVQFSEKRSWSKTVSEFLSEKKIVLGPLDKLTPLREEKIKNKDTITIVRIGERDEEVEEAIAYQKIQNQTKEMYKDERKLQQKGSDGKRVKTFRLRYENNVLVARDLIHEEIVFEAKNEITLVGIKPRITVRCRFNEIVEDAAAQYGLEANSLCRTMMCESNGNPYSGYPDGPYQGLFQYEPYFWIIISARAGFAGASITDAKAQIYVTAWAWAHGYRGRWPNC